jgi:hypothetical protein
MTQPQLAPMEASPGGRVIAGALALGSALFVLTLMLHAEGAPATTLAEAVRSLAAEGTDQRVVHGMLFLFSAVMLFGYAGFALRIGLSEAPALAGLVAYAIATLAVMAQTLLDGIVLPAVAARYTAAPDAELAALKPLLVLSGALLGVLFQLWLIGSACAILLWSIALLRRPGFNRIAAAIGFVAGALPLASLAWPGAHPHLPSVTGIVTIAGAQAIWALTIAAQLARGRL